MIFGCTSVSATEENKSDTLTITCQNQGMILSNMEWKIYKIADIRSRSTFTLSGDFEKYPVNLDNLSTSEMQTAAVTLETYAKVDEIVPQKSGITDENGIVKFDDLEYGVYLISGKSMVIGDLFYMPAPSVIMLSANKESGVSWHYDLNALPKLKVLPVAMRIYDYDCFVKKTWTNDSEETRPESITVSLVRNGEEFDTELLTKDNNWQCEWHNLSSDFEWNIIEKDVPENYTVTYSQYDVNTTDNDVEHDIEYVINNTFSAPQTEAIITTIPQIQTSINSTPSATSGVQVSTTVIVPTTVIQEQKSTKLPQTGQLWWPVPFLSAGGLIVFSTGWKINSHKRRKDEK